MKITLKIISLLAIAYYVASSNVSVAGIQSDSMSCTQKLNKASKLYDAGKINEVEGMLSACLQHNLFTKEEKMQALRLIILSYLFQDEHEKAEQHLLMLLHEDPEYKLNKAVDPAEFYQLFNSYRTLPIINLGIMGGINRTSITAKKHYSVDNINNDKPTYKAQTGFHFGLTTDILLYRNFQININALFTTKSFLYTNEFLYNNHSSLRSKENQLGMDLPLSLKYNFGKGKLKPYLYAGGAANLLFTSSSVMSRENTIDNTTYATEATENLRKIRNTLSSSTLLGAGLRYKIGYGYIILDARYMLGMKNMTQHKNRFHDPTGNLLFYYGYLSSDFHQNNLAFSVGYLKSIYKPKKIKNN